MNLSYVEFRNIGVTVGVEIASMAVSLVLLLAILTERNESKNDVKYLFRLTILNVLSILSAMAEALCEGNPEYRKAAMTLMSLSVFFYMLMLLCFSLYQYHEMKKRVYVNPNIGYVMVFVCLLPCIIGMIGNMEAYQWFIKFDENGYHSYQPSFWMVSIIVVLVMAFNFMFMLSCRKDVSARELFAWVSYEVFPAIVYLVMLITNVYVDCANYLANTLSIVLLYTITHLSAMRDYAEQETQLQKSQMQLMVSQIQPHFLYNSLNSIYTLIDTDTEVAQEAVEKFSDYLRQNINSLKSDDSVKFTEELEHTKAYIYLEQLRFGDRLNIEYDIKETDFLIPPLSVQPLVENAIKHGVSKKAEGGTVKISSYSDKDYYIIRIEDDGVGFNAGSFDDENKGTHIGMFNVSSRIQNMVNGKLIVKSVVGEGTTCTIKIPKQKGE